LADVVCSPGVFLLPVQPVGVAIARSGSIATLTIAAIAGAVIVARAQRSSAPLERVVGELERVVTDAIALG